MAEKSSLERGVLALYDAPYKRVYGRQDRYVELDVRALHAAARDAARAASPIKAKIAPPPSAVTTTSLKEYKDTLAMNVPPRYAPCERYSEPLTAGQEVGWKVGAAFAAKQAAATRK